MDSQQPTPADRRGMYWFVAALIAFSAILDFVDHRNYLKALSGLALVGACAIVATSPAQPAGAKRIVFYALLVLSGALMIANWFAR